MNIVTDIKTKNFIHELTGIAQLRKYLDEGKIPSGYNELLNTKEPKLKKIINFLRANPEPAEILFMYIEHLENEAEKSISNRDEIIYEYSKLKRKQIEELDVKNVKILFKCDVDIVRQNENMYPILFNYFDFIKNEVLNKFEAKKKHTTNEEVYKYISGLTFSIKWTAVKTYYNQKYLYLIGIKK